jgi:NADH-quinone oxidoreductase subunit J
MTEGLIFYLFATVLVGSALAVISSRNPVHGVLFLILAFFNAAGLFILLGAEFIAMLLVIVYVGAVAVLFLFVVMMLNVTIERFREGLTKYFASAVIVATLLFIEMIILFTNQPVLEAATLRLKSPMDNDATNTEQLGAIIYTDYVFVFQASGLVLLVAMIGAIVLTFEKRNRTRKQSINTQNARKRADTLEIVQVETGRGVK